MECKEGRRTYETKVVQIGIYPEWNVKFFNPTKIGSREVIGIYPEWNVKT